MSDAFSESSYVPPSREYLTKERGEFRKLLGNFATYKKLQLIDFKSDLNLVDEISMRVHQRLKYYMYFHKTQLEQSRWAAIRAYWILRYKPVTALQWSGEYDVNVHLAFFVLFFESMGNHLHSCSKDIQKLVVNNILREYEDEFLRSFSEYDISKEAMMLISDSLKSIFKCEIKYHSM